MKRILRGVAFASMFTMIWASVAQASPLTAPISKMTIPNKNWSTKAPTKTDGTQKIMYPTKIGQAVNVRAHTYEVPVSARAFVEQVRAKIIQKPDYEGAEVRLVEPMTVKGKTWDCFSIKRKDEINQKICANKTSKSVVFMIIYTGAGGYYDEYFKDYETLLKKAS